MKFRCLPFISKLLRTGCWHLAMRMRGPWTSIWFSPMAQGIPQLFSERLAATKLSRNKLENPLSREQVLDLRGRFNHTQRHSSTLVSCNLAPLKADGPNEPSPVRNFSRWHHLQLSFCICFCTISLEECAFREESEIIYGMKNNTSIANFADLFFCSNLYDKCLWYEEVMLGCRKIGRQQELRTSDYALTDCKLRAKLT